MCGVSLEDLQRGEIYRLHLASMLRAGEQPARAFADAVVLLGCGTLLERIYGPAFVVRLVVGSTIVANAGATVLHASAAPVGASSDSRLVSTSGGLTALGAFCALRHGRWAIVPGLPVPAAWLMAPLLAAVVSSYATYRQQMAERRAAAAADQTSADSAVAQAAETVANDDAEGSMSTFEAMVALAGCEAAEQRARSDCRPAPADIVAWREEVEQVVEASPPLAPDGAFLADILGACLGAAFCLVARRVV